MGDDSVIFLPSGGSGEFTELAERIRAADPVRMPSRIVPIQHTHVEWIDVSATRIGLEEMSVHNHFLPLALVPLEPFLWGSKFDIGFSRRPLYRLSWYGQPVLR
jgi:hypothetical protein